jgi:hypothetical protein
MAKALVALCCLLAMEVPASADAHSEAALIESDLETHVAVYDSAEDGAEEFVHTAQWGGRMWTCVARSRRTGRTFSGQSRNANAARRIALNRCWNRANGCFIASCR